MSNAGQILENPVLKDRITFLRTAADTNGEYLRFRVELAPGGGVLMHYHTTFTEHFEVVEGVLYVDLSGKHLVLHTGQSAEIPLRNVHKFYNPTDQGVTFIAEVRSARQFEKNMRITYGLARDGKTNRQGIPTNPLHLAVVFQFAETYLPGIPAWVQRLPFVFLRIVARLAGVEQALIRKYL